MNVKGALGLHKAKSIQGDGPTGVGQFAFGSVQSQSKGGTRGATGHADGLGRIVHHQGFGLLCSHLLGTTHLRGAERGANRTGLRRHGHIGHIHSRQAARKFEQQGLTIPKACRHIAAPGSGDGALNLIQAGIQAQTGGALTLVCQHKTAVLGGGGESDALHLGHGSMALGEVVRCDAGTRQSSRTGADVGHIHTSQCARKTEGVVKR